MSINLPDLDTSDIGIIARWNALQQGADYLDPARAVIYDAVDDWTAHVNGIDGTIEHESHFDIEAVDFVGGDGAYDSAPTDLIGLLNDMEGSGTEHDPYQISDPHELQAMGADPTAHYVLVENLDMSGTAQWNGGDGFSPIGDQTEPFEGSLDGYNNIIQNVSINRPTTDHVGVISHLAGEVTNIGVEDIDITGNNTVGGLIARMLTGDVHGSHTTGNVSDSTNHVGGLVGEMEDGRITECYSECDVHINEQHAGGLVGILDTGDENSVEIRQSYATGNVSADETDRYARAGGLVCATDDRTYIAHSFATGDVHSGGDAGGLIALMNGEGTTTRCFATGAATTEETQEGGLIANHHSVVEYSYWNTSVNTDGIGRDDGTSSNIVGLSDNEMRGDDAETNMSNLSFGGIWTPRDDNYPLQQSHYFTSFVIKFRLKMDGWMLAWLEQHEDYRNLVREWAWRDDYGSPPADALPKTTLSHHLGELFKYCETDGGVEFNHEDVTYYSYDYDEAIEAIDLVTVYGSGDDVSNLGGDHRLLADIDPLYHYVLTAQGGGNTGSISVAGTTITASGDATLATDLSDVDDIVQVYDGGDWETTTDFHANHLIIR